jgi:O-acetyl-ADP-ribose deacetylase (regulator of RNase III)
MPVTLHSGSILDATTDAIVNPANSHLRHGGGLARVIDDAATKPFYVAGTFGGTLDELKAARAAHDVKRLQWDADHASAPLVPVGAAHATSPGVLDFKAVIHAVGPVWGGGHHYERELLADAHNSAFMLAEELQSSPSPCLLSRAASSGSRSRRPLPSLSASRSIGAITGMSGSSSGCSATST